MSDRNSARAKILGDLIKNAREYIERSQEACARVLNISLEEYQQVEEGTRFISLPDMEALVIYLGVPMAYFWGTAKLEDVLSPASYSDLISLRHRVIGILLRQLRLQEKRTQKDLAEALDVDRTLIRQYEIGETPIPYVHLEQLCRVLGVPVEYFVDDQHGPLARHEADQKVRKMFHQLSPEIRTFLLNPVNERYLEVALRLSLMDVGKLRQIAESLLDITY